jgi:hypothetical protein
MILNGKEFARDLDMIVLRRVPSTWMSRGLLQVVIGDSVLHRHPLACHPRIYENGPLLGEFLAYSVALVPSVHTWGGLCDFVLAALRFTIE